MDNSLETISAYVRANKPTLKGPINGNGHIIMAQSFRLIKRTLRDKFDPTDIDRFKAYFYREAKSRTYHKLLQTCQEYVEFDI